MQVLADKVILGLILFLYTAEVGTCTLALSFDVKHPPLAVLDFDRTPQSRTLERSFLAGEEFTLRRPPGQRGRSGRPAAIGARLA
jgi:ABC-2 type transport system permease protein